MITWAVMYRAWPIYKCGVVGCKAPRTYDTDHGGLVRRWCEAHAALWDREARDDNKVIEVRFGEISK